MKQLITLFSTLTAVVFSVSSAEAVAVNTNTETKIRYCNKTEEKIFMSVAYQTSDPSQIMARGWWGIEAGACSELSFPIYGDKLYVHAQSSSQVYQWLGQNPLCVNTVDAYDFENAATRNCAAADLALRKFKEVSLADLISEAGTQLPTYQFTLDEAQRVASGIKFCNDTDDAVYISFAQSKLTDESITVNGWFKAAAGKCFEAARNPEAQNLHFFAQNTDTRLKWKGSRPLCTDDYDGFSYPNASTMACDLNNQKTQLFNSQILPASGDFEYHFQTQQAHKARSILEICNSRDKDTVLALAWEDSDLPGQYMSKGWYVLAAGKCLSNMVVDSTEVLLHVEDDKRELLLPGTVEACVDDLHAFQFSKATQMACNGTNQMRAKFATQAIDAGDTRLTVPN